MTKPDPLAEALNALDRRRIGGVKLLVDELWSDRPEVLDSIRAARARGLGHRQIAEALTVEHPISEGAVRNWCKANSVT